MWLCDEGFWALLSSCMCGCNQRVPLSCGNCVSRPSAGFCCSAHFSCALLAPLQCNMTIKDKMVHVPCVTRVQLVWRAEMAADFPDLAVVADKTLGVHPTGTGVERFWACQRHLLSDNRLSMNPETAKKLLFASSALRMRRKEASECTNDGDVLLQDLIDEEIKNAMQAAAAMAAAEAGTLS